MQDGAATTISGLSSGEWYVRIGYVAPDGKLLAYSTPQKFVIHGRLVDSQGRPVYSGFGQPIGLQ